MYPNPAPNPPAQTTDATPSRPASKRRSVGGAVLLETLIPGAGFVYAGRIGLGIVVLGLSIILLTGFNLILGPVVFGPFVSATQVSSFGFHIITTDPSVLNVEYGAGALVIVYAFVRFVGAARAVFLRNKHVAGSSRPLAGRAGVISVLSGVFVILGAVLYFSYQQMCSATLFSCSSPVFSYRLIGDMLLISGAIGLLIGLIG